MKKQNYLRKEKIIKKNRDQYFNESLLLVFFVLSLFSLPSLNIHLLSSNFLCFWVKKTSWSTPTSVTKQFKSSRHHGFNTIAMSRIRSIVWFLKTNAVHWVLKAKCLKSHRDGWKGQCGGGGERSCKWLMLEEARETSPSLMAETLEEAGNGIGLTIIKLH